MVPLPLNPPPRIHAFPGTNTGGSVLEYDVAAQTGVVLAKINQLLEIIATMPDGGEHTARE